MTGILLCCIVAQWGLIYVLWKMWWDECNAHETTRSETHELMNDLGIKKKEKR